MWAAQHNQGESYTRPRTQFSTRAIRKQAYFRVIGCNRDCQRSSAVVQRNFYQANMFIYIVLFHAG